MKEPTESRIHADRDYSKQKEPMIRKTSSNQGVIAVFTCDGDDNRTSVVDTKTDRKLL